MKETRTGLRKKQKKSFFKKMILTFIVILIPVLGYGSYLLYQTYEAAKESYKDLDRPGGKSALREEAVTMGKDPISLLLIGVEAYSTGGENGRADTLIVVTLNPETKKMTMVSIPRDTRVEFLEEKVGEKYDGFHKINSAYTWGSLSGYGANKLTVEKVEELLEIPIDEYATVGFKGFVSIVNALGGVTVDVKVPFWEENKFTGDRIYFKEGSTRMNGEEALAFVRMRKRPANVEYSRMERQRQFLKASLDEATSAGTLFKVDELADMLGKHVDRSLSIQEIYHLQKAYSALDSSSIKTLELKSSEQYMNGISFQDINEDSLEKVQRQLKKSLGLPDSE